MTGQTSSGTQPEAPDDRPGSEGAMTSWHTPISTQTGSVWFSLPLLSFSLTHTHTHTYTHTPAAMEGHIAKMEADWADHKQTIATLRTFIQQAIAQQASAMQTVQAVIRAAPIPLTPAVLSSPLYPAAHPLEFWYMSLQGMADQLDELSAKITDIELEDDLLDNEEGTTRLRQAIAYLQE
jgi:hypothetical protein